MRPIIGLHSTAGWTKPSYPTQRCVPYLPDMRESRNTSTQTYTNALGTALGSADALGAYHSTLEEARADLFALYYMADERLIELGLLPDHEAYKACYYRYLLNGLVTQLVRIRPGHQLEEAHMRNRALIARYVL